MARKRNTSGDLNATHRETLLESGTGPFTPGEVVLVTLNSPREKFWGVVLGISPAGLALRGMDLNSFEDFARMVKVGDAATPHAVFFPMHRVERAELDARNGDIPSLQERFFQKTGSDFIELFVSNTASSS